MRLPLMLKPQSGITNSHAFPTGYARNWIADWERLMDGNRNVYKVLTPLPKRQNPMPITHMRSVRHGKEGSSGLKPTPAAYRTSRLGAEDSSSLGQEGIIRMESYWSHLKNASLPQWTSSVSQALARRPRRPPPRWRTFGSPRRWPYSIVEENCTRLGRDHQD